jgi:integrase
VAGIIVYKTILEESSMNGRIEKRGDDKYVVIVEVGRDAEGKRRRVVRTVNGNQTKAKQELRRLLNEMDQGVQLGADRLLLSDYLRDWLKGRRGNLKPRTYESYEYHIERHLIPALGAIPLGKLAPLDIERYKIRALETATRRTKGTEQEKTLTPRSVDSHLTTLNQALKRAVQLRMISYNPCEGIERPKYESVKYQVLEPEELGELLAVAREYTIYPIVALIANTGLRLGEALGLEWADIDLKLQTAFIHQQWQRTPQGLEMRPPKSKRSVRNIPLTEDATALLRPLHVEGRVYVFPGRNNVPRDPSSVDRAFKRITTKLGRPDFRLHDLRHTFATILLANGVPLSEVQEILGHEQASTTANIYVHTLASRKRVVADTFGEVMKKARESKK